MKNTPRIYVGTYGKYNAGSLFGAWFDLDGYADYSEFKRAFLKLHCPTEPDAEFMFQDWEAIPEQFISESSLSPEFWDYMEFVDNSYMEEEAITAGLELDIPLENLEDAYAGEFANDESFAEDMAEQMGAINATASWPEYCIDWGYAARVLMFDYNEQDGHYFSNNY